MAYSRPRRSSSGGSAYRKPSASAAKKQYGSRSSSSAPSTEKREAPRRIADPVEVLPVNKCVLQGVLVAPAIRDTRGGHRMWTGTLQVPDNPDPMRHSMIDLVAWDEVAEELDQHYEHGDPLAVLCEVRWYKGIQLNVVGVLELIEDEGEIE